MTKQGRLKARDVFHKLNHHRQAGPHGGARRPDFADWLAEYLAEEAPEVQEGEEPGQEGEQGEPPGAA